MILGILTVRLKGHGKSAYPNTASLVSGVEAQLSTTEAASWIGSRRCLLECSCHMERQHTLRDGNTPDQEAGNSSSTSSLLHRVVRLWARLLVSEKPRLGFLCVNQSPSFVLVIILAKKIFQAPTKVQPLCQTV